MAPKNEQPQSPALDQARLLISRLERLSADSVWAHRASGVRGALLKSIETIEQGGASAEDEDARLEMIMQYGFYLLEKAALELLK
jgi:hypothetical protein